MMQDMHETPEKANDTRNFNTAWCHNRGTTNVNKDTAVCSLT